MRHTNFALALLTAAVLSACGGSDNNNNNTTVAPKPKFASQVTFGDSLSDVGTYQVGPLANPLAAGKYTINGTDAKIWTELLATTLAVGPSCPAQQGLNGPAPFNIAVTNNLTCTNYAQGGARVTDPAGPGNIKYADPTRPNIGQLTVPVVQQIANHLTRNGGKFNGNELVTVMAGGNDALQLLEDLKGLAAKEGAKAFGATLVPLLAQNATDRAGAAVAIGAAFQTTLASTGQLPLATQAAIGTAAAQAGNAEIRFPANHEPHIAKATLDANAAGAAYASANGPALVPLMSTAGRELATLIRTEIVAKGGKYVLVNNLPNLAGAPASNTPETSDAQRTLIAGMVSAFNTALSANLNGLEANVLYVDLYSVSVDQVARPANYGLDNVKTPACTAPSSLSCNAGTLVAGVTPTSKYLFADGVHPTPYAHSLIAKYVTEQMTLRGWL